MLKAKNQGVSICSLGVPWAVPARHPQNLLERAANLQKGGSLTMLGLSRAGRAMGLSSNWGYVLDEIHHIWRCLVLDGLGGDSTCFCCFSGGDNILEVGSSGPARQRN